MINFELFIYFIDIILINVIISINKKYKIKNIIALIKIMLKDRIFTL